MKVFTLVICVWPLLHSSKSDKILCVFILFFLYKCGLFFLGAAVVTLGSGKAMP